MGNSKTFGTANEFYRARVISIEEILPSPFEWREDVLFGEGMDAQPTVKKEYQLQVVATEGDTVHTLDSYPDKRKAEVLFRRVEEDLGELTKMQFEKKYFDLHETPPSS